MRIPVILLGALAASFSPVFAQELQAPARIDARMMQMPAVSASQIAFVYAGDIWIVPKEGGNAVRLSSPRGTEQFPRFSPDGREIAFSANYEGNTDIYVMPVTGGEPRRVTHHGAPERMLGWYADGKSLLIQSTMEAFTNRVGQLFRVPAEGGLPEKLPVPYGEFGAVSADGKKLAYTTLSTEFRTWKRYRGGMAPDIWLFDLETKKAEKVAPSDGNESLPMWSGTTLYFLSDRDKHQRENIWAYDTVTKAVRHVTHFEESDVHFPSIGPKEIVLENAGRLYLLDLASERLREVPITVVTDRTTLRPRVENVSGLIRNFTGSPTGKRVLFEARGDIFSVPMENGVTRNLTATSGVAERFPAWSPDGKWVAYFSDRTGEYELTIRPADGKEGEQTLTQMGPGFRYQPWWSPDSKKIVFIDQAMRVWLHDLDAKTAREIDKQMWMYQGDLDRFRVSWSADSRWIAYAGDQENRQTAIVLYDTKESARRQVTSGFYEDDQPVFDPNGNYLYYRSKRWFDAIYSEFEPTWIYANSNALVAVPLRKDVPSPLAPRNDEEPTKRPDDAKPEEKKTEEKPKASAEEKKAELSLPKPEEKKPLDETTEKMNRLLKEVEELKPKPPKPPEKPKPIAIDLDGFEARAVVLPPRHGRFEIVGAAPGRLVFTRKPRAGSGTGTSPMAFYDVEKREEKPILDDAPSVELSADGKKLLVARGRSYAMLNVAEGQGFSKAISPDLEATIDPPEEWRQIFNDAWRIERDFFYDPHLHMVMWQQQRERYGKLLDDAVTRSDVNYILGELLGELNVSHAYRGGGDIEGAPGRSVGYLGCDFAFEQGAYRIKKILEPAPWEYVVRSPLKQPGLNVKEGDFLLAVNGEKIDVKKDPWAAFQGLADKPTFITVNDKPNMQGARDVLVQPMSSEYYLRHYAWCEENRRRVEKASGGRIGYVYVPSTAIEGQNELYRQFRAQFTKPGLIIDERWNSGGQIPDRFIELLGRKVTNYWGVRDGRDWQTPMIAHSGAKAILANGWSGSGGDCFPWLFRKTGLGPIIGTRTWGGLIGMTGAPPLIDGGNVTVPTFSIYDTDGQWIIEGRGVEPDMAVEDDPSQMQNGADPQLDRAIKEVLGQLEKNPVKPPGKPVYPNRAGL